MKTLIQFVALLFPLLFSLLALAQPPYQRNYISTNVFTGGLIGVGTRTPLATLDVSNAVGSATRSIFHAGTNNSNGLTVSTNGNVGIDNAAPAALLHMGTRFKFNPDGTMNWGSAATNGILSWDGGKAIVMGMSQMALSLGSGGVPDTLYITNGNVGIGTTAPLVQLDVLDTPVSSVVAALRSASVHYSGLDLDNTTAGGIEWLLGSAGSAASIAPAGTFFIRDGDNNVTALAITKSTGNVGIGTTTPTSGRLVIDGGNLTFGTDNTYDIGASGANRPRNIYIGGFLSSGTYVFSEFSGGVGFSSAGEGVMRLHDSATTDFNRLQFGGTTAAFPALGRTNGNLMVFGGNGAFGSGSTNRLIVQGLVEAQTGTLYTTNVAASLPSAATIGVGGYWVGNSNGFLVTLYSLNGTTTAMKVLAP